MLLVVVACGDDLPADPPALPAVVATPTPDAPLVCAPGFFASGTTCTPWSTCAAGTYVEREGTPTSDRVCTACAPNAQADVENAASCTPNGPCVAGTASPLPNGVCAACEPGTYCAGGAAAKAACAGDTWDDDGAAATACVPRRNCAAGTAVETDGDATSDRTCAPCAEGTYASGVDAAACKAWTDCGPGTTIASAGSDTTDRACQGCASGTFSAGTNGACTPYRDCLAGSYVLVAGTSTNDRTCRACAAGYYTNAANLSACTAANECAAGSVQTAPATPEQPATCAACEAGTHCAGGANAKVACGGETWDDDGDAATPCGTKTRCARGSSVTSSGSATADRTCALCQGGYSTSENAASCTTYTTCGAGSFVKTNGTPTSDRTCAPCGAGTYSTTDNAASCTGYTTCALGRYVSTAGTATTDQTCADCPAGTTTFTTNATACVSTTVPAEEGPVGCQALVRVDRTIVQSWADPRRTETKATDQYEWYDATCAKRTAALVRSDNKGGHAIEMSYLAGATRRVVAQTPEEGDNDWSGRHYETGGFGYVVAHLEDSSRAHDQGEDDSPLGSSLDNAYRTVFVGSHHAIHEFTLNYPRWGKVGATVTRYDMPVTVHWMFRTGMDAIVYAITFDLSAAPDGAVNGDLRAPYGEMQIDGTPFGSWSSDPIANLTWADSLKFKTSAAASGLTMNSAWSWNESNSGPAYNALWTKNTDAEMGTVMTDVIARMEAGGYTDASLPTVRGLTSAGGGKCAQDPAFGNRSHTMPCAPSWAFQSVNYGFSSIGSTTTSRRLAWGSDWGTLGKSSIRTVNGRTVRGWPRVSYSVLVALDVHSKAPTTTTAAQVEVIHGTTLTATKGTVRTTGPAGIARADSMTYQPAGYSPVYGTWEIDADAGGVTVGIDVAGGTPLVEPTFVVHGYAGGPPTVSLDGKALVANRGFFSSQREGSDLWLTLHQKLKGTGHVLAIGP